MSRVSKAKRLATRVAPRWSPPDDGFVWTEFDIEQMLILNQHESLKMDKADVQRYLLSALTELKRLNKEIVRLEEEGSAARSEAEGLKRKLSRTEQYYKEYD